MPSEVELTVIVNNYNYGRYLAAAIDSALAQTGCRIEVVVVDDGSTDESDSVLEAYQDRCTVIRQANGGQGAAMNTGLAAARGPVTMFLDSDDVMRPGVAERMVRIFAAHPNAVRVQIPMRCIDADGRELAQTIPSDPATLARGDLRSRALVHPDDLTWQPTSGNAFRTEALRAIAPIPEPPYRISADHYISNLTTLHGDVVVDEKFGVSYRIHGANADYRDAFDLERLHGLVTRTVVTHECLRDHARRLGLAERPGLPGLPDDPLRVRSVTFAAGRLVSLRLDPGSHPIAGDRRTDLVRLGWSAVATRADMAPARRWAARAWFLAVAFAPRRAVRALATRALG